MFKKVCLFLFIIFFLSDFAFASYEDKLFELETLKYGKSFHKESISQRLLRLEEDYFGMSQSGDITSRIDMLDQIAQTNYPNYMNFNRQMPIQKKSKIKSILKDFASVFTGNGVITGYIPPMSSYDDIYYNDSLRNNYNGFHNAPKYTPNYVYPYGYDSHYPNYNIQYDRNGLPKISNRDLYSRSAVKILRD